MQSLEERAWTKIRKDPSGCWIWTATLNPDGYGRIRVGKRTVFAHRAMYELQVGPIPAGLQLDHLCRVRECVNPEHLEPVTNRENSRRASSLVTHCPSHHAYSPENTRYTKTGARYCLTCKRLKAREWRARGSM